MSKPGTVRSCAVILKPSGWTVGEGSGEVIALGDAGVAIGGGEAADPLAGGGARLREVVLSAVDHLPFVAVEITAPSDREQPVDLLRTLVHRCAGC